MQYEYLCGQCMREYIWEQRISEDPLSECPHCREAGNDSPPPKRLISLSSFKLNGGGWADTGYSNK